MRPLLPLIIVVSVALGLWASAHLRVLRALPQSPHASLMPPFVVCQGVHGLVAPTKHAW